MTNAPPVASAGANHAIVQVVLIGCRLLKDAQVTVGAATVEALDHVRAEVCVLSVCSFHPEAGPTTFDSNVADVKGAMVACSGEVIARAPADELRTARPWVVAGLADVHHLATDGDDELARPYARAGLNVVVV